MKQHILVLEAPDSRSLSRLREVMRFAEQRGFRCRSESIPSDERDTTDVMTRDRDYNTYPL